MVNKPDKFDLKFWFAADVQNKYLFHGFFRVNRDEARNSNFSVPADVVLKLMAPLF